MTPEAWRPWRRAALAAGGLIVLLWLLAVGRAATQANEDLDRGRDQINDARASLTLDAIVDGSAAKDLRAASTSFAAAETHLRSPILGPGRYLPILGRQIRSVSAIASTASVLLSDGAELSEELGHLDTKTSAGRLAALDVLSRRALALDAAVEAADLGPRDGLVGPLHSSRVEVESRLAELRDNLRQVGLASEGLSILARGPSRILVLATSNAEMRIGQGAALQFGIVDLADGSIRSTRFERVGALRGLPPGFADPDVATNWGWLGPPNLAYVGLTPRFDAVARHAAGMVSHVTGERFDAVLQLDAVAIAKLVTLTGPVDVVVGGQTTPGLIGDALLKHLLYDQYLGVSTLTADRENNERREALSALAVEALARVEQGKADIGATAEALAELTRGRHLHVFSERPEIQAAFDALGAPAGLPADVLTVGMLNAGANKLDAFLEMRADVETQHHADRTSVKVTVTIRNETPSGAPPYVIGQVPPGTPPQGYAGLLTVTVPAAASGLTFGAGVPVTVLGRDGPAQVISALVTVGRKEETVRTVTFDLPPGATLTTVPTGRWPELRWGFQGKRLGDDEPHTLPAP